LRSNLKTTRAINNIGSTAIGLGNSKAHKSCVCHCSPQHTNPLFCTSSSVFHYRWQRSEESLCLLLEVVDHVIDTIR
jgi:hypothetical protein